VIARIEEVRMAISSRRGRAEVEFTEINYGAAKDVS
jgi:hypothetical protein